LERSYKGRDAD